MAHTLEDLREHLFETLQALRDKEQPMDIARARAISEVAQTVINSAKAEVDYVRATEKRGSLPVFEPGVARPALPAGVTVVRTHRLK